MNPRGMVPSHRNDAVELNENDTLLGSRSRETGRSPCSITDVSHTCKKAARLSRCLAIGALLFTIVAVSVMTVGTYGPEQRTLKMKERKAKDKWKEQMKELEEEEDRLEQCNDGKYSKTTLKLAYELPYSALFKDNRGIKKFEASSVIVVGEDVYSVCDSSWAISKFGSLLTPFSYDNIQIGNPDREEDESGYEALLHDEGTFYVVRESILHADDPNQAPESYHAIIEELVLVGDESDYTVQNSCSCEFEFEGDSKGFEGAISLRDTENDLVILGLCEGNLCSESAKDKPGNGRVVAMKKEGDGDGCEWKTVKKIHIPSSAHFIDYSAITINDEGRVAISSQENSQVWIGQLKGLQEESGLWDLDQLEFDDEEYDLFQFPKSTDCHTVYCNIEGIHWLDNNMLMAVSDKMKSKGKQDFRCFDKDQSVHAFVLP